MRTTNSTALKAIVAMGVVAFLFLFAASFGLKSALRPNEAERVRLKRSASPFDADAAKALADALAAAGSRAPGKPGHEAARALLLSQPLRTRELTVGEERHVLAEVPGRKPGTILIVAHYSAFSSPQPDYVGANDGAAASACLVALARGLGRDNFGRNLLFAWLGGNSDTPEQIAQSATGLVDALRAGPNPPSIDAALYLDAVGDCYLHLADDAGAPGWMRETLAEAANSLGLRAHFGALSRTQSAVSIRLNERGTPSLALIDDISGGSLVEHGKLWHTALDTPDRVCRESLKAVGDVLYHALPAIDARLDGLGSGSK